MQTLPIPADAANALLPSMGSASNVPGAKTAEFSQVLQQWDSATRPPADCAGNRSQDATLTHGSAAEAASGEEEALPRNPSTGASQTFSATRGASTMESNLAVVPGNAANQLAINIDNAEVLTSGDSPKPGGTKKADAKQAGANPHIASQRAAKQSSNQQSSNRQSSNLIPAGPTVAACAAVPSQTVVPLPTFTQAALEPGASAYRGTSVPPAIPVAASGASSAAQPQAPTTANAAPIAAADAIPEAASDAMREVAGKAAGQASAQAMTTAAASAATSAQLATASFPTSIAEPVTLPSKAKPQAAMAPARTAPNAQAAGGMEVRSPGSGTQPAANAAPLSSEKVSAKGGSTLNHSLPVSEAGASSRATKSSPRDDNASRAANSTVPRQMNNGTDASASHDSNAASTPAPHDQAASQQSSALQSAALHSAGFQTAGGQAAAAPATAMAAPAVVPAPPQGNAPASRPQQLPPNATPAPAPTVDSGQLQVKGGTSELKISVQLPELGKVEVRAVTSQDVTTAHLTASHPDALQALSAGRSTLEQALNSRDVILGSLDARGQNSQHQSSQHQNSQHQQSQPQGQPGGEQRQHNPPASAQSSGGAPSAAAIATTSVPAESGATGLLPDYSSISVRA